jgi:hypothetical protein
VSKEVARGQAKSTKTIGTSEDRTQARNEKNENASKAKTADEGKFKATVDGQQVEDSEQDEASAWTVEDAEVQVKITGPGPPTIDEQS